MPKVSYYSDHFFVLENVGLTVSQWLCNKNIDEQQKFLIIYDTCLALIDLHAKNLVHGRLPFEILLGIKESYFS